MKLQAEIGGKIVDVDVRRDGDKVSATVDGREYSLEVSEPENGVLLFKNDGQILEAFVSKPATPDLPSRVTIRGLEYDVSIMDRKKLRSSGIDHAHTDGEVEIRTAMPGKVVRLLAAVGEEIKKGDGIIVVEAMKMQNEMKSPKDGLVKEVRVAQNDTVNAGQTLVVIE